MKAVILAAGEGIRLRPLTISKPKIMLPVANKPIIQYLIEALSLNGIREIIIVIGYKKERIMSYFGDGDKFGVKIDYVQQNKQIGTAHALKQAEEFIDDDFIVLPGDNLLDESAISNLMNEKDNAILISESVMPSQYGVVNIENDIIKNIKEIPIETVSNLVSTGTYKFSKDIFGEIDEIMEEDKFDLTSAARKMINKGITLKGVRTQGWIDIIYPWNLLSANALILPNANVGISGKIERYVKLKRNVNIGKDTVIRSNTYIVGPVVIGRGCEIGPNVCIFPSTSIGDNVKISPFTEIKNSIIMDDVNIDTHSMISGSVIGDGTVIGSHFTVECGKSFLDFDAIPMKNDELIEVDKIGAIIGEDSRIGNHVVIGKNIIGANTKISSFKNIHKNIPNNSIVV